MKWTDNTIVPRHDMNVGFGGGQVRSYVISPYQLVKDLRTGVTTSDIDAVLDGDLDRFMQAALAQGVHFRRHNDNAATPD